METLSGQASVRHQAEIIQGSAQRATAMVRQLLAFSRKQVLQPTVLNVDTVVGDLVRILERLIGEHIELTFRPGPGVHAINADRGQTEQVIINLCVNARDAMPGGGRLTIETANTELPEGFVRGTLELGPGAYVVLVVTDTGCGMSPDVQARIFEPFFTTKGDRGTGLGLATVYGIVKQSGGDIAVDSEAGRGTTFRVYLPAVRPAAPRDDAAAAATPEATGSETILLVEDEPAVRALATDFLKRAGYTVLSAGHPADALVVAEGTRRRIDAIVTDVVMPGMTGPVLVERIRVRRPDVAVLYMSGYSDVAIEQHGILAPDSVFLEKPFAAPTLCGKIREALARRRAARDARPAEAP
jgi:CheY-like chemotaxis protein